MGVSRPSAKFSISEHGKSLRTKEGGEQVIVDHGLTLERILNIYFWFVNTGSLSGIATRSMEKRIGSWAAYLLPFCSLWTAVLVLALSRKCLVVERPLNGSTTPVAFRAIWHGIQSCFDIDAAQPANQHSARQRIVSWNDDFIDELKQGLRAC